MTATARSTVYTWIALVVIAVGTGGFRPATGQIPIPTVPNPGPADTVTVEPFRFRPPISPLGALGRSILLPGWGQAALGRRVTGAFFVLWEGLSLAMTIKSAHQLTFFERTGADEELIAAKRQEREDWIVLLVFNHLVAGAEAFVAAQLWDFPDELRIRALPDGQVGIGASFRLP